VAAEAAAVAVAVAAAEASAAAVAVAEAVAEAVAATRQVRLPSAENPVKTVVAREERNNNIINIYGL
jgi:hypothetical protein